MRASTIIPAIILLSSFSGCVAASESLSNSDMQPEFSIHSHSAWVHIRIGVTTQKEVQNLFGTPTDVQTSSVDDVTYESWAYVPTTAHRHPLQYLPFLGSLAMVTPVDHTPFSVSFTQDGIVDGLAIAPFQVQGSHAYRRGSLTKSTRLVYGMNNPQVHEIHPNHAQ